MGLSLDSIKSDDTGRMFVLADQKVGDDGFEVGCSGIYLAPYRAKAAEMPLLV